MPRDSGLQDALALAFRYLNRRERTVFEIRRHLDRHGCREVEIERAIELLTEQGYLDDGRYARLFAEDKRTLEQWGSERIRLTLLERGIDSELVQEAVASELPPTAPDTLDSDASRALGLLRRRFPTPPREPRELERALGVLLRRGYETDAALEALAIHQSLQQWCPES